MLSAFVRRVQWQRNSLIAPAQLHRCDALVIDRECLEVEGDVTVGVGFPLSGPGESFEHQRFASRRSRSTTGVRGVVFQTICVVLLDRVAATNGIGNSRGDGNRSQPREDATDAKTGDAFGDEIARAIDRTAGKQGGANEAHETDDQERGADSILPIQRGAGLALDPFDLRDRTMDDCLAKGLLFQPHEEGRPALFPGCADL